MDNSSKSEPDTETGMTAVQRQLAEYRRRMTEKSKAPAPAPIQEETKALLLKPPSNEAHAARLDAGDKEVIDIAETSFKDFYMPPGLSAALLTG